MVESVLDLDLNLLRFWKREHFADGKYYEKDKINRMKFLAIFSEFLLQIKYWIYHPWDSSDFKVAYQQRTSMVCLYKAKSDAKAKLLRQLFFFKSLEDIVRFL